MIFDFMTRRALALVIACLVALGCLSSAALAKEDAGVEAQRLVHLLGYVSGDYGGAVAKGEVVNQDEYAEQLSLLGEAERIATSLQAEPGAPTSLQADVKKVHALVEAKADEAAVKAASVGLRDHVMKAFKVAEAPTQAPDHDRGAALYATHCASCHGATGHADTEIAKALRPAPANFHDDAIGAGMSPFRAFTTVRFGVEGTAMVPIPALSDQDRWDVAFFTASLRHMGATQAKAPPRSLTQLATQTDGELEAELRAGGASEPEAKAMLVGLRVSAPYAASDGTLAIAVHRLNEAKAAIGRGERDRARSLVVDAYLDGIEPAEGSLRANDPVLSRTLEDGFRVVRSGLKEDAPPTEIIAGIDAILVDITRAEAIIGDAQGESFMATAIKSGGILLREGVEAALLIAALLGLAAQAGLEKQRRYVHYGWALALVCGAITWLVSSKLIAISGASRETTEGVTALIAAAVLFYVSYSLLAKSEVARWMKFLKEQVTTRRAATALFGVSFLAAYREAFETVLFYQALLSQSRNHVAAFAGIGVSAVLLVLLVIAYTRAGRFAPPQMFFRISGYLLYALVIVFVGQGLAALQTVGYVPLHMIPLPGVAALGIFPTLETYAAQGLLILAAVVAEVMSRRGKTAQPTTPKAQPT